MFNFVNPRSSFLAVIASLFLVSAAGATDRIVMITDSHGLGHWGAEMTKWLRERPDTEFDFFASGGSAPLQWIYGGWKTPLGLRENSESAPAEKRVAAPMVTLALRKVWADQGSGSANDRRITVIAHGTNYHHENQRNKKGETFEAEEVAHTAKLIQIAQAESDHCVWIGPPNMTKAAFGKADVMYKYGIIRKGIAKAAKESRKPPCDLIRADEVSEYPAAGPDGIHYNYAGVKNKAQMAACSSWAKGVTDRLGVILNRSGQ